MSAGSVVSRLRQLLLVALVLVPPALQAQTVEYIHTDALGTPIAVTNASRVVIERSEYEPYGKLLNRPLTDGPGFTGHVQDAATGMTYMQQRYYDPQLGIFLSVDPVTANSGTGTNFNRYWYANNNPYTFKDPDGRIVGKAVKAIVETAAETLARKALKAAKNRAVKAAWREERQLVASGRNGTRNWTAAEKQQLVDKGKVDGYAGHHRNTANGNKDMAGNPDNIEFMSRETHKTTHSDAGGTQVPISNQPLLDRTDGGSLPRLHDSNGYREGAIRAGISVLVFGAVIADGADKLDPFTYMFYIDEAK